MLHKVGVLSSEDAVSIADGLTAIEGEIAAGTFLFREEYEDIHMNVEARLAELIGPAGGTAAHRAVPQRSGGGRFPPLGAGRVRRGDRPDRGLATGDSGQGRKPTSKR